VRTFAWSSSAAFIWDAAACDIGPGPKWAGQKPVLAMSMYTADAHGLARSLVAGLPFAKYTFAGDLIWAGVFFGSYALCTARFAWPLARLNYKSLSVS